MMHYRFECSLCGMSAHNSAANWLHPITPTYTVSMIQGKWYYRAEVVLTEAETAPSTRPTFHLSPPFNLPKNTGRKQGRPDEIVCQRAEGIENGFRARGGGKKWGGNQQKEEKQGCWHLCIDIESMLNESGSSTSWPPVCRESLMNCSHHCSRFNERTVVIVTAGWLHSHGSCYYTDDCKNEEGKQRSGFDIETTTLPLWFISKSETVMGEATLSVFFWVVMSVCVSATGPHPLFFSFRLCSTKKGGCAVISADRRVFIASDMPYTTLASAAILNAFGF